MENDLIEILGKASLLPQNLKSFKQIQIHRVLEISEETPNIVEILSISVKDKINNKRLILTPKGTSYEGQILTGKKLIIHGELNIKLEYLSNVLPNSPRTTDFRVPCSSYIILREEEGDDLEIETYIPNIYVKLLSKRKIVVDVLILLNKS